MKVPFSKFKEMSGVIACGKISESEPVQTVYWLAEHYIITGGVSQFYKNPPGLNYYELNGYRCSPLSTYSGDLKPMRYADHWRDVDNGGRARSYSGMIVKVSGVDWVMYGDEIVFTPNVNDSQGSLF